MKLIVAEKPSVAIDIAKALGANTKSSGYYYNDTYKVTWLIGHLLEHKKPDEYNPKYKKWSIEDLPIKINEWLYNVAPNKEAHFKIVTELMNSTDIDEIVCATDAGREGELIFRLIYNHIKCRKKFKRLWISSYTNQSIVDGFNNLYDSNKFDNLSNSALSRSQADYLIGYNFTRLFSVYNNQKLPIGRVLIPTLNLVVERDNSINNFKASTHYILEIEVGENIFKYSENDEIVKSDNRSQFTTIINSISSYKNKAKVEDIKSQIKTISPDKLFSLTTLQQEANECFGYTAKETLEIAQLLYEKEKMISYPRTESEHVDDDVASTFKNILSQLDSENSNLALKYLKDGKKLSKKYVDETKLTDHHAIIPTGINNELYKIKQKNIYSLIVKKFISIFYPDYKYVENTIKLLIGPFQFIGVIKEVLQIGFKCLYENTEKEGNNSKINIGDYQNIDSHNINEIVSKPPKLFTDASLLSSMKNISKKLDDENLKQAIKNIGIGTPATRADIIERLISYKYLVRTKKNIYSTIKGRSLISVLPDLIKSPEMTAMWEEKLKLIEDGIFTNEAFMKEINTLIYGIVSSINNYSKIIVEEKVQFGNCPGCNNGVIHENQKYYYCSEYKNGCHFSFFKYKGDKLINHKSVTDLLTRGYTNELKGFKNKAGKKFKAKLSLRFESDKPKIEYMFK